jgi:glycosyltransferase involved in cell wall biosynthesis
MKILMLAWRDIKNPKKGGAEIVTDIYLKGLSKLGHNVTLFTASYPKAKKYEKFNNYKIIRKGNSLTVSLHGLNYAKKHEKEFDVIIDQVNTIPFFTPLLISSKKRVAFFHQLCKNIWFHESKFPISAIGYLLESIYLKLYKNTKIFVVSESTKKDLIKHAWAKEKNILVLDNQIDFKPISKISKKEDYFVFCGRLTKSKRVNDCIKAISKVKNSKLYIIGSGNEKYKKYLNKLISKLGVKDRVKFTGKISNDERNNLMSKALAILVTSQREGWGLIVTEANANGTIAITYNIEGVVDANKTGYICSNNNFEELAKLMIKIKNNPEKLKEKNLESLEFAKEHSNWNKKIKELEKWLKNH